MGMEVSIRSEAISQEDSETERNLKTVREEFENCETHIIIAAFVLHLNKTSIQCKSLISLHIS